MKFNPFLEHIERTNSQRFKTAHFASWAFQAHYNHDTNVLQHKYVMTVFYLL